MLMLWHRGVNTTRRYQPGRMQRPGIIRHYIVHSVEIDGKQTIHVFAVVLIGLDHAHRTLSLEIRCPSGLLETMRRVH